MSQKRHSMILLVIVLVAVMAVGLAVLLPNKDSRESSTGLGNMGAAEDPKLNTPGVGVDGDDSTVLVESASGTTYRVTKPKDTPTPPATTPSSPQSPPTDAWQQYVEETRAVVENNEAGLLDAIAAVDAALRTGDGAALEAMLAPDEGATGYGEDLARRWPAITAGSKLSTINIFSSDQATLYFAYVLVEWQDAGIASEHTIPIVFRFANGRWVITVLGETGTDLTFVQTVTL